MSINYAMRTNPGDREINEDSASCVIRGDDCCFVVADGLGGHGWGEEASQAAVAAFESVFLRCGPGVGATESLHLAFNGAQNAVLDLQKAKHARSEMKTTAVALAVVDGRCAWGHIGDSRLYLFNRNKVKARTLDHSVPQMLVLSGEISERKIRGHPDRNRLLRAIGVEWDSPRFELSGAIDLSDAQAFLLCSDGFWEWIEEKRMCAYLKKANSAEEWLTMMTAEVEKNGRGHDMDNYTAIAVIV